MIISFDLDGVLFVGANTFETELPLRYPLTRIYPDRLRKGTVYLINELKSRGFDVWVYTSSYRSELYIRTLFMHYRITFDQIINAVRHNQDIQENSKLLLPSKLPNRYHISLHIDDEEYVVKTGQIYGFNVLRISDPDPLWAEKIIEEAERIRENEARISKFESGSVSEDFSESVC